jgi:hypothetical protein
MVRYLSTLRCQAPELDRMLMRAMKMWNCPTSLPEPSPRYDVGSMNESSVSKTGLPKVTPCFHRPQPVPLSRDHPANHILDPVSRILLHYVEPHNTTGLTLEVLYERTEQLVVSVTARLRAPIESLLMCRAFEMHIQARQPTKHLSAQIALVAGSIP